MEANFKLFLQSKILCIILFVSVVKHLRCFLPPPFSDAVSGPDTILLYTLMSSSDYTDQLSLAKLAELANNIYLAVVGMPTYFWDAYIIIHFDLKSILLGLYNISH